MKVSDIQLIRNSWKILRKLNPELVGDVFYSKLFADNPGLRKMYPKEMDKQCIKLINMLNVLVAKFDRIDQLTEEITEMAMRHENYGVTPSHYKAVGTSLIWTLEHGLGSDFTPEVRKAWSEFYTILSSAMIDSCEDKKINGLFGANDQ